MPISGPGRFTWLTVGVGLLIMAIFHVLGGSLPEVVFWVWVGLIGLLVIAGK